MKMKKTKKTRKLKDIAEELLDKYKDAKTSVIWEYSFCIKYDIENLDDEIETYKKEIEKASEQEKSN